MRNFVVCDRRGEPLAKIRAASETAAESFALRSIVGAARLVEVRSMAREDIETRLTESFKRLGMSDASAKAAATRASVSNLREYQVPAGEPALNNVVDPTNDVHRFVDRYANSNRSLYETFRRLGLDEKAAGIAAKGRE